MAFTRICHSPRVATRIVTCFATVAAVSCMVADAARFGRFQCVPAATVVGRSTLGGQDADLLGNLQGQFQISKRKLAGRPYLSTPAFLSVPRGGGTLEDSDLYDSEEYDESDFDFDDDDVIFGFDDGDFEDAEDDFGENGMVDRMQVAWEKTPPFTKAYMSLSVAATTMGYVTNQNQFPNILLLKWNQVFTRLQIWRPITAFLNIGPFGFGYFMTAQFVWTYMATLERMSHSRPYDFWLMIFFAGSTMLAGYHFLNIPPNYLGHNLSTFLVYVWSRYHEGMEVNMFELFNSRAEMLPWLFLAQTFLLEGAFPTLDLLGIIFGHIYHHLSTTNALKTPSFVIDWYKGDGAFSSMIRQQYKEISSDFEMQ